MSKVYPPLNEVKQNLAQAICKELKLFDYTTPFANAYEDPASNDRHFHFNFDDRFQMEIYVSDDKVGDAFMAGSLHAFHMVWLELSYDLRVPTPRYAKLLAEASEAVGNVNTKFAGMAQDLVKTKEDYARDAEEIQRAAFVANHFSKVTADEPFVYKGAAKIKPGKVRFMFEIYEIQVNGKETRLSLLND